MYPQLRSFMCTRLNLTPVTARTYFWVFLFDAKFAKLNNRDPVINICIIH